MVRPPGGRLARGPWPGHIALATWTGTPEGRELLVDKNVIELGATMGLVGAAAYHDRLGDCAECCLTAFGREIVRGGVEIFISARRSTVPADRWSFCSQVENLERPDANNGCRVQRLNWYDFEGDDGNDVEAAGKDALASCGRVDVALAAEVVDHDNGLRLAKTLNHMATLNPNFKAVLVEEVGHPWFRDDVLPALARFGFFVDKQTCEDVEKLLENNIEMMGVDWSGWQRVTIWKEPVAGGG